MYISHLASLYYRVVTKRSLYKGRLPSMPEQHRSVYTNALSLILARSSNPVLRGIVLRRTATVPWVLLAAPSKCCRRLTTPTVASALATFLTFRFSFICAFALAPALTAHGFHQAATLFGKTHHTPWSASSQGSASALEHTAPRRAFTGFLYYPHTFI